MYSKYVENLIKNTKDTNGDPLIDVGKLRSEWESISKKFFSSFRGKTFTTFSQRAKSVTYAEIKDRISDFSSSNTVKLITEYSESGVDQVTDDSVINKWDEWEKLRERL